MDCSVEGLLNLFLLFPLKEQLTAVQGLERDVASYKPQMDELELVNQVSGRAVNISSKVIINDILQTSVVSRFFTLEFLWSSTDFVM